MIRHDAPATLTPLCSLRSGQEVAITVSPELAPARRVRRAPRKIAPIAQRIDTSILDRFIASNTAVREVAARARGHDVNRVRFSNPFVPPIRFTVGTGLQIIARHNHRHLLQAERVRHWASFPRD